MGLLLGHLFGDYLFQGKYMAMHKSEDTPLCLLHCALYTICVCFWSMLDRPMGGGATALFLLFVFGSHFVIDRFSLATVFLKRTGGRTFETVTDEWDRCFTVVVYVGVDNGMHLACNYWAWSMLI